MARINSRHGDCLFENADECETYAVYSQLCYAFTSSSLVGSIPLLAILSTSEHL